MAAGGAAAAIAQAIKASGVVIRVAPYEFRKIIIRMPDPLVVIAQGGVFSTKYRYLTSYKGLAFFTKSDTPLDLPAVADVVTAERIWVPG